MSMKKLEVTGGNKDQTRLDQCDKSLEDLVVKIAQIA